MDKLPLLNHPVDQPSVFTPDNLIEGARRARQIPEGPIPELCILEFDGDLTDWLVAQNLAKPFPSWPCFHTTMFAVVLEGITCGIIPRTIGGPYAVLIAEQLATAGAQLIVGLTSAGRAPVNCRCHAWSLRPAQSVMKGPRFTTCRQVRRSHARPTKWLPYSSEN